jgi:ABC-type multidrug transport system permease subunit
MEIDAEITPSQQLKNVFSHKVHHLGRQNDSFSYITFLTLFFIGCFTLLTHPTPLWVNPIC